jgi:hypothetical protein
LEQPSSPAIAEASAVTATRFDFMELIAGAPSESAHPCSWITDLRVDRTSVSSEFAACVGHLSVYYGKCIFFRAGSIEVQVGVFFYVQKRKQYTKWIPL